MEDTNSPENQDKNLKDELPEGETLKEEKPKEEKPEGKDDGVQGFKTLEDAVVGYKNVQGAYTKATQENKELREQMAQVQEQVQLMQMSQPKAQAQQPDFDTQYIESPEKAIDAKVAISVQEQVQQAQVATALNELNLEKPAEFQDRYAYAQLVSRQYPQLVTSPAGVKKLFEMGDKLRVEDMKRNAEQSVNLLFGDNVDMGKLKELIQKKPQAQDTNQAYMPDTTQSTGTRPEPEKDTIISKAVQEGDPDKVLEELLK